MSQNTATPLDGYAILFAAITGTRPEEWSNLQRFCWDDFNIDAAPPGPRYGNDVFAITLMDHKDGRQGQVCYDLQDYVYFDCGDLHWSGPLEADVHSAATWHLDFEAASKARQEELEAEARQKAEGLAAIA